MIWDRSIFDCRWPDWVRKLPSFSQTPKIYFNNLISNFTKINVEKGNLCSYEKSFVFLSIYILCSRTFRRFSQPWVSSVLLSDDVNCVKCLRDNLTLEGGGNLILKLFSFSKTFFYENFQKPICCYVYGYGI